MKCKTCGGTYEPTQADGSEYYHVCGPIPAKRDDDGLVIRWKERRNKRDERVKGGYGKDAHDIIAEGRGVRK